MKQILLLVLSFFLFSTSVTAQNAEFAPVGASFRHNWSSPFGVGNIFIKIVSDTTVNGQVFKKMFYEKYNYALPTSMNGYYQSYHIFLSMRNDSVFMGLNQGQLLFNFSAQIGDTIKFTPANNSSRYAVADSIGQMNFLGTNRRVVYLSRYCKHNVTGVIKKSYLRDKAVANFGLLEQGLIWNEPECGNIDADYHYFVCYQSSDFRYPTNCSLGVAINEVIADKITLAPNPASNDLHINYPSELQLTRVELTNYLGQTISVHSSLNNQKINVSNMPNGVYFLRLQFDNQQVVKKIIVQH